jgi:uncharacterized protein (DUF2062 family)
MIMKKPVRQKELEKMWKSVDLKNFWQVVIKNTLPHIEAYRKARAKSRGAL